MQHVFWIPWLLGLFSALAAHPITFTACLTADQGRYQIEVPDNWLENGNPFDLEKAGIRIGSKAFGGYVNVYVDETQEQFQQQEGLSER